MLTITMSYVKDATYNHGYANSHDYAILKLLTY